MAITAWTIRKQSATRAVATRTGEGWTNRDLAYVTEHTEASDTELALALGRTLFAIQSIKHAIVAGRANGSTRTAPAPRRERAYDPNDFAWSD